MKKFLSLAAVLLALTLVFALPLTSFAATREELVAKVKDAVPAKYYAEYQVQFENALDTLAPTAQEYDELLTIVDDVKEIVAGKGDDLNALDAVTKNAIVEKFRSACETLDATLSVYEKPNGGSIYRVYKNDGTIITEVIPDPVKPTGAPAGEQGLLLIALAGLLGLAAVGCFVGGKRLTATR